MGAESNNHGILGLIASLFTDWKECLKISINDLKIQTYAVKGTVLGSLWRLLRDKFENGKDSEGQGQELHNLARIRTKTKLCVISMTAAVCLADISLNLVKMISFLFSTSHAPAFALLRWEPGRVKKIKFTDPVIIPQNDSELIQI